METISFSSASSRTTWVFGTFTSIPDWITGAVTIKMMSNTRTISMKGIMLISASDVCVLPSRVVIAIRLRPSLPWRREFPFGVHPIVRQDFGSDRQNDLENHGWNRGEQTKSRCNQGIGNSGRNSSKCGRVRIGKAGKRCHDAPDSAE